MRLRNPGVRRPLTDEELGFRLNIDRIYARNDVGEITQQISLGNISREDRRKEAKKTLYLVRYE